ncbi:MAG: hypothetical protein K4445_06345 [Deltaproteobacteria bacterium]|jgi:rod shape-determining protein MreD|nr:hypothetical protein [Syntrophaceae bacterium]
MIFYLLLPFAAVLLVVLQTTLADVLFNGWLTLELTLVLVIYAGFHLDLVKGMIAAFVLGLVFDSVAGAPLGLFALLYLLADLFAFFVSFRIVSEKLYLIAGFALVCSLLESLALVLLYRFAFEIDMLDNMLFVFIPQALLISILSVGFFYAMRRVEGWMYGKTMQSPQRTGTFRISPEA